MGTLPQIFYTTVGLGRETVWGDAATPTVWLPIEQPRFNPGAYRHILDSGLRGLPSQEFDLLGGPGEGTVQWQGNVYDDSIGHLLTNLLGLDTVSEPPSPYTHTITPAAAPPSHTLQWVQGVNAYDFAGLRLSQLQFNFRASDGALTYTAQGTSKVAEVQGSPTAAVYTAVLPPLPGWRGAITGSGGGGAPVLEMQLTFTRALRIAHTLTGLRNPSAIYPGPIQVTGRITMTFNSVTQYNYYAAEAPSQNAIVATFAQAAGDQLSFTVTKAGWRQAEVEINDNIYTVVAQVNAIHNATDAGPAKAAVINTDNTIYSGAP